MSSQRGTDLVGKTLEYEETLASLPVPSLKQTCIKYLESVKPCVNDKEFLETKSKVLAFCKGIGPVLQKHLEERAAHSKNWLEEWWEEYTYKRPRYPLAPMVNISGPVVLYEDIWPPRDGTQINRTAVMLHFLLKEWKLLYSQERAVDNKDCVPHSMSQYYNLMSWCQIPEHISDSYVAAFKPAPASTANYVTVITKGRIYKCVILDEQLDVISIPEIEIQLRHIEEDASKKPVGPGLGSLTCEDRSLWAKDRQYLLSCDGRHRKLLETIQHSIITVVLDDESPSSIDEVHALLNGGNCHNRWFDKSFQVIVFKNGFLGNNLNHLAFDAVIHIVTGFRAMDNIRKYWKTLREGNVTKNVKCRVPKPAELEFHLNHRLHRSIQKATRQFKNTNANITIRGLEWKGFGKVFTKQFKIHPDTFVQMAIQLADYKLHKRIAPTYETASTRQFYHGRTDTVRTHTVEVQRWCKSMENFQATAAEKVKLLRIASLRHDELMKEAINGLGIDRHLLGLKIIAEECGLPAPDIFTDVAWKKSGGDGNFILSTSLLGYFPVYGATLPMVEDGYGCFYSIEDKRISFSVTAFLSSKVTNCGQFMESLKQSLLDMQQVLTDCKL